MRTIWIVMLLLLPLKAVAVSDDSHLFPGLDVCFLVYDLNSKRFTKIYNHVLCNERLSPCSTFKVALSLMGFDSRIFIDENTTKWQFNNKYPIALGADVHCLEVLPLFRIAAI